MTFIFHNIPTFEIQNVTQNSNNMKTEIKTSQEKPKLGTYVFGGQCIYGIVKLEPKKNK